MPLIINTRAVSIILQILKYRIIVLLHVDVCQRHMSLVVTGRILYIKAGRLNAMPSTLGVTRVNHVVKSL